MCVYISTFIYIHAYNTYEQYICNKHSRLPSPPNMRGAAECRRARRKRNQAPSPACLQCGGSSAHGRATAPLPPRLWPESAPSRADFFFTPAGFHYVERSDLVTTKKYNATCESCCQDRCLLVLQYKPRVRYMCCIQKTCLV